MCRFPPQRPCRKARLPGVRSLSYAAYRQASRAIPQAPPSPAVSITDNRDIHRRRHDPLPDFLGFEEPAVTQNLVDLHLFLFEEDVQPDLQCAERREQVHAHEVRQGETAFGGAHEQRAPLLEVRDGFARKIIVGQQPAAIRLALERLLKEEFKQLGLA